MEEARVTVHDHCKRCPYFHRISGAAFLYCKLWQTIMERKEKKELEVNGEETKCEVV